MRFLVNISTQTWHHSKEIVHLSSTKVGCHVPCPWTSRWLPVEEYKYSNLGKGLFKVCSDHCDLLGSIFRLVLVCQPVPGNEVMVSLRDVGK